MDRADETIHLHAGDGRGAVAALTDAVLPDSSRFSISDVVMGRAGGAGHVVWNSGTTAVDLNPLGTFPSGDDAAVYYQLAELEAGKSYRTTITFFGASDAAGKKPRLQLTFNDVARQSRIEVARTMGLKNLDPGAYRMVVAVGDGVKSVTGKTRLTVVRNP
ncbi:MAG TPA: hypothetical protein VGM20_08905 [Gemmatimonadales bacterium]